MRDIEKLTKLQEHRNKARHRGDHATEAAAISHMTAIYFERKEFDKCLMLLEEELALRKQCSDLKGEHNAWLNRGRTRSEQGLFELAISDYLEAARVAAYLDAKNKATTSFRLGTIYYRMGNILEAEKAYTTALLHYRASDDINGEAETIVTLSHIQLQHSNYVSARQNLLNAQKLGTQRPLPAFLLGRLFLQLATAELCLKNLQAALANYSQASIHFENAGNQALAVKIREKMLKLTIGSGRNTIC